MIDADLPRALRGVIEGFGHAAIDVRDIGLGTAPDSEIAAFARTERACLLTGDFGFADIRNYPPAEYAGIVVLGLPRNATAATIIRITESLLQRGDIVERLPGRLAIVEAGSIRVREA